MNERGLLSGFLLSKMSVALAVLFLIGSVSAMYSGFTRETHQGEFKTVLDSVISNLREVDSLPGEVRLERDLPEVEKPYEFIITGEYRDYQLIKLQIQSIENFQRTVFLSSKVNGGSFRIERKNPRKVVFHKSDQVSMEVI